MIPVEQLHRLAVGMIATYYNHPVVAEVARDRGHADRRLIATIATAHELDAEDLATLARVVAGERYDDPAALALNVEGTARSAIDAIESRVLEAFAGSMSRDGRDASETDLAAAMTVRVVLDIIEAVRTFVLPTLL